MLRKQTIALTAWMVSAWLPVAAAEPSIHGEGSSAAAPIYQAWAQSYQKVNGVALAYEPSGSSAGLKKIRARETDYGASDVAPSEAEIHADGLVVFPVAITGIAPVVNLPKTGEGQLRLSADVLARIFLGEIKQWNAPEIAQLNPEMALPKLAIKVVVRSDGSGTTYNFADYLAKVSPQWKDRMGVKASLSWPAGFVAVKGSDGVVGAVQENVGAIGYVDFGYVQDHKLNPVQLPSAEGDFLKPSTAAFRVALAHSEWVSKGAFTDTLTHKAGKGAWPITMGTFILLPRVADKPEQTRRVVKFFVWAFMHGDELVQQANFVRLPDRVQASAFKAMASIKDKSGNSIGLGL